MHLQSVQPPLSYLAPQFKPWILKPVQWLAPLWLRWQRDITHFETHDLEQLAHLYHRFQSGELRLLIAFRHPTIDDPLCLTHLLGQALPQEARRLKLKLPKLLHAHFIYDRGLPIWIGSLAHWILPRLGALPIHRGKLDRVGLRTARELLLNGPFPLAIAPEGTINGHNQILNPLEPGTAQLAFWGLEDVKKAGLAQDVVVVPIGIQYHYSTQALPHLHRLLVKLEQMAGYPASTTASNPLSVEDLYQRMLKLCAYLLRTVEQFYRDYFDYQLIQDPVDPLALADPGLSVGSLLEQLQPRLKNLLNAALTVAETRLGLQPKATLVDRRHAIEQAAWSRIFRDDIEDIQMLAPAERGLADHLAQEASLLMWHMRLVETFIGVAGETVGSRPLLDRLAETSLQVWKCLLRMQSQDPLNVRPPYLGPRQAHIRIGDPLSLEERWGSYQSQRRQAVATLTQDLQKAFTTVMTAQTV